MYRDEILAIGEAIREAHHDGTRKARDFYVAKLGTVCHDARRMLTFAGDCAKIPVPPTIAEAEALADIDTAKSIIVTLSERINTMRREGQRINSSVSVPDFREDVPF